MSSEILTVSGCQAPVVIYSGLRTQARFQKRKKWRRNKTKQLQKAKEKETKQNKNKHPPESLFFIITS